MKVIAMYIFYAVLLLIFVAVITYFARSFSQAVTPINTYVPKQGITCAYITTTDGAAISCWKD